MTSIREVVAQGPRRVGHLVLAAALGLTLGAPAIELPCVHPDGNAPLGLVGDLNASGTINVADAVCALIVATWELAGAEPPTPSCLLGDPWVADLNCDGSVQVNDVLSVISLALGQGLLGDGAGRGCHDACVPDCGAPPGGFCFVGGQCAAAGAADPSGACASCDPAVTAVAFSPDPALCEPVDECGDGICGPTEGCGSCVDDCCPIGDLVLWLRADSIDAAASDPVASWVNQGSLGGAAIATSAAREPHWWPASVGGRPAVRFDGVGNRLDLPGNPTGAGTPPYTMVTVLKTQSQNAHIAGTGSSSSGFLTSFGSGLTTWTGLAAGKANSSSSGLWFASQQGVADGEPHVLALVADAQGSRLYVDGRLESASGQSPNPHAYPKGTLGASDGSNTDAVRDPLAGDLAEVRVYHRALSTEELDELTLSLAVRYDIPVQSGDGCPLEGGDLVYRDDCGVCGGDGSTCAAALVPEQGRVVWLRAHDLAALPEGAPVWRWHDADDLVDSASQAQPGRRPVLVHDAAGGLPAVHFDGVDDRLDLSVHAFSSAAVPLTVFAVIATDTPNAHIVGTGSSSPGFVATYGYGLSTGASEVRVKALSNSTMPSIGLGGGLDGAPHVFSAVVAPAVLSGHRGGATTTWLQAVPNPNGYAKSTLGASDGSDTNASRDPMMGSFSELLVYHRALSEAERVNVEAYLAAKYQLAAPIVLGCDGVVGSGATRDLCGVCGGDGSACAGVGELAGLELWLRATDLGVHGPAEIPVATWPSALLGGVSAAQGTVSNRPQWHRQGLGGLPSLAFDGAQSWMSLSTNLFGSAGYPKTVFVVLQTTSASAHVVGTGSNSSGYLTSFGGGVVVHQGRPHAKANSSSSGLFLGATEAIDDGQPALVEAGFQTGGSFVSVDGGPPATSAATVNAHGYSVSAIGATGGGRDPLSGHIAEILSFSRVLDATERALVRGYLQSKYGL